MTERIARRLSSLRRRAAARRCWPVAGPSLLGSIASPPLARRCWSVGLRCVDHRRPVAGSIATGPLLPVADSALVRCWPVAGPPLGRRRCPSLARCVDRRWPAVGPSLARCWSVGPRRRSRWGSRRAPPGPIRRGLYAGAIARDGRPIDHALAGRRNGDRRSDA